MTAALRLIEPEPTLDERLAEAFAREDALIAERAQVRAGIQRDRLPYMAREGVFGLRVEAIRRAVCGDNS